MCLRICAFLCLAALAAVPVRAAEFVGLNGCGAEPGIAIVTYGRLADLVQTHNVISEVCLDRTSGTLTAAESARGFLLTRRAPGQEYFELIFNPVRPLARETLSVFSDLAGDHGRHGHADAPATELLSREISWLKSSENRPLDRAGWLTAWLKGYVGGQLYTGPLLPGDYSVHGTVFVTSVQGDVHNLSGLGFPVQGRLQVRGAGAVGTLSELYGHAAVSDTRSDFHIVNGGGRLNGGGRIATRNPVLAGAAPTAWQTLQADITAIMGRLVGAQGREMQIVAEMTGTAVRMDGGIVPFTSILTLVGWRTSS